MPHAGEQKEHVADLREQMREADSVLSGLRQQLESQEAAQTTRDEAHAQRCGEGCVRLCARACMHACVRAHARMAHASTLPNA